MITLNGDRLVVNLDWTSPFILGIVAVVRIDSLVHVVRYGNEGKRLNAPYAHLAHTYRESSRTKLRREHLVLPNLNKVDSVDIAVVEREAVERRESSSFLRTPEISLTMIDPQNISTVVELPKLDGNCLFAATIQRGRMTVQGRCGDIAADYSENFFKEQRWL